MSSKEIENSLETILTKYSESFSEKVFSEQSSAEDDLMRVFGLTQEMKSNNRQYWGRELGACWERLVKELCQLTCDRFQEPHNTSYDLAIANDAIDTKYRLGSGDAKTLRGFKHNAQILIDEGFNPIMLIVRTDNLSQAIRACISGGWQVKVGDEAYQYLYQQTQFDLKKMVAR
ncbi:hypothetical protein [Spirulina sp. 06S082]|uniref:hypothetical protein n=1 Tax=Spirulina sp. 06S082 TaxID=3110248 RepID=UPI002B21ED33|nr:hypothetical protein [Spirulina sp. 06S082]MEA5468940.1 hypothetical protein [Spirulina sp. 06S082]